MTLRRSDRKQNSAITGTADWASRGSAEAFPLRGASSVDLSRLAVETGDEANGSPSLVALYGASRSMKPNKVGEFELRLYEIKVDGPFQVAVEACSIRTPSKVMGQGVASAYEKVNDWVQVLVHWPSGRVKVDTDLGHD